MMNSSTSSNVVRFFRYMRLFRVTCFSVLRVETDCIHALVAWNEDCPNGIPHPEDAQEVCWKYTVSYVIDDALIVGEYAYDKGWIASDKIEVDEAEIQQVLGWGADRVHIALKDLLKLRVPMIDDGEEEDAFFLHG